MGACNTVDKDIPITSEYYFNSFQQNEAINEDNDMKEQAKLEVKIKNVSSGNC